MMDKPRVIIIEQIRRAIVFAVIAAKSALVANLFVPSGISSVLSKLACLKVPLTYITACCKVVLTIKLRSSGDVIAVISACVKPCMMSCISMLSS